MHKVEPERIMPVLEDWHRLLKAHDVRFFARDYSEVRSGGGDFLYLDPPTRLTCCSSTAISTSSGSLIGSAAREAVISFP